MNDYQRDARELISAWIGPRQEVGQTDLDGLAADIADILEERDKLLTACRDRIRIHRIDIAAILEQRDELLAALTSQVESPTLGPVEF